MKTSYVIYDTGMVQTGQPFRLLPFGPLVKGGRRREVTPELARQFALPNFKPPIKLGSHAETTPAGGFITALEVRDDGLWAIPEMTEAGAAAIQLGQYRYHSPEIIWDTGVVEDSTTGATNTAPLVWGCALLHTPHLGEGTAFYTAEVTTMSGTDSNVTMPSSLLDRLLTRLNLATEATPSVANNSAGDGVTAEQYAALQATNQQITADLATAQAALAQLQAERDGAARVAKYTAALTVPNPTLAATLAGLDDEAADALVIQCNALAAQAAADVTQPVGGNDKTGGDPVAALQAAVEAYQAEAKVDYNAGLTYVATNQPDLWTAAQRAAGRGGVK